MSSNTSVSKQAEIKSFLESDSIKNRFAEVLGKRSGAYLSSVISVVNTDANLAACDPKTIAMSALMAASLDLPIIKGIDFAHIVPYGNKAQFQMGWRGFVQLAQRSGQYKTVNVGEVYAGELVDVNRMTGEIELDPKKKTSDEVIGYFAHFELLNGFKKTVYKNVAELLAHGKKYSPGFGKSWSKWTTDFPSMGKKTVIKELLSKWGPLSVDYQTSVAVAADQAIINDPHDQDFDFTPHEELESSRLNDKSGGQDKNNAKDSGEDFEGM